MTNMKDGRRPAGSCARLHMCFSTADGSVPTPQRVVKFFEDHGIPNELLPQLASLDLDAAMHDEKTKTLAKLKELGVSSLKSRQAVANALSKERRAAIGHGMPVLVCLYSSGLEPQTGRELLAPVMNLAAKGPLPGCNGSDAMSTLVLDLPDKAPHGSRSLRSYEEYISSLIDEIDAAPERRGRPLILVAHSLGAFAAYRIACRLGERVRHLTLVTVRAPLAVSALDEIFPGVPAERVAELTDEALLAGFANAWSSKNLSMYVGRPTTAWAPAVRSAVAMLRAQFLDPATGYLGIRRQYAAAGAPLPFAQVAVEYAATAAPLPLAQVAVEYAATAAPLPLAQVVAPILCICSGREPPQGETAEKMQAWAELTTARMELVVVDETHMGAIGSKALLSRLPDVWRASLLRGMREDHLAMPMGWEDEK